MTSSSLSQARSFSSDLTAYHSLPETLQYLTFTRPDIAYVVQQVCLHIHDPHEPHLTATKRILWYLQGTLNLGWLLHYASSPDLIVYPDADWVDSPDTRQSTSGYTVFLGDNRVSWSSKRQHIISHLSAKAKYRTVANDVAEACCLRQLLMELHNSLSWATLVYCNNISVVYLSNNYVQHQCIKHIEIDLHFVREHVAVGDVRVLHVPTTSQFIGIFTKGLPSSVFSEFQSSLNIFSS
jgi:hypothetical protein